MKKKSKREWPTKIDINRGSIPLILQTVAQKRLTETIKILIVEFRTFFVIENKIVIKIFSN
jgi:hypothetical protein